VLKHAFRLSLSEEEKSFLEGKRVGIARTLWHREIVDELANSVKKICCEHGVSCDEFYCSGSFELPYLVNAIADSGGFDGAVACGCIIKGETNHDFYIATSTISLLAQISVNKNFPVSMGIITAFNYQQAIERAKYAGINAIYSLFLLLITKNRLVKDFKSQ